MKYESFIVKKPQIYEMLSYYQGNITVYTFLVSWVDFPIPQNKHNNIFYVQKSEIVKIEHSLHNTDRISIVSHLNIHFWVNNLGNKVH